MSKAKQKDKASGPAGVAKRSRLEEPDRNQPPDADSAEEGNLEKIRDIIFGTQMRDYEKRFTRLQERLLKEVKDLREETNKRFDSFESYMAKELESLSDRLKTEQNARAESVKGLSRELKDTAKSSEKKTSQLDDQLSKISRELRQQILDQSKTLSGEIRQKQEETSAMLDEAARELRVEKVDRSTLAQLLTEVALHLSDELAMKLNLESKGLGDE